MRMTFNRGTIAVRSARPNPSLNRTVNPAVPAACWTRKYVPDPARNMPLRFTPFPAPTPGTSGRVAGSAPVLSVGPEQPVGTAARQRPDAAGVHQEVALRRLEVLGRVVHIAEHVIAVRRGVRREEAATAQLLRIMRQRLVEPQDLGLAAALQHMM